MALNIKDYRFLIIDDLREMRMTVRGMLDSLQVKVMHEAKSGDEALEILSKNPVDVVLCDYNLGEGRDGQQTLEEARGRNLLLPTAAWIMITAEQGMSRSE
ncbi:MAG: response regulator, partial [Gammaproteobacteria bacterium]